MSNKYKKAIILSMALSQLFCNGVIFGYKYERSRALIFNEIITHNKFHGNKQTTLRNPLELINNYKHKVIPNEKYEQYHEPVLDKKITTVNKFCDYQGPTLKTSLELMNNYQPEAKNYRNTEQEIINQISYWFKMNRISIATNSKDIEKFCSGVSFEDAKQVISNFLNKVLTNRNRKFLNLFKKKSDFAKHYKESNSETLKGTLLDMSSKRISKSSIMNKKNIETIIKLIEFLEISNSKVDRDKLIKELDNFSGKLLKILKDWKSVINDDYYDENEVSNITSAKTVSPSANLFDSYKNLDNICRILENFLLIFRSKPYREIFNNSSKTIKDAYQLISKRIYDIHDSFEKDKKTQNIDEEENFRAINGLRIYIENLTNIIKFGENNYESKQFQNYDDEFKLKTNRPRQ